MEGMRPEKRRKEEYQVNRKQEKKEWSKSETEGREGKAITEKIKVRAERK